MRPGWLRYLWLLPILLFVQIAVQNWNVRWGLPGETGDFYSYALQARLGIRHPEGLPPVMPDLRYPDGEPRSVAPELFSEPLTSEALALLGRMTGDPIRAVWLGVLWVSFLNLFVAWSYFWKKYSRKSALALWVGWSTIALCPWWFARSDVHWHLSFLPLLLVCMGMWFDFFTERKQPRLWFAALAHGLLFSQSIYYGAFMIIFVAAWTLAFAGDLLAEPKRLRQLLALSACVALGYGADLMWVTQKYGGLQGLKAAVTSGARSNVGDAYVYSNRVRELIRGARGSPADRIVAKFGRTHRRSGMDSEGFPAPFPKMAVLVLGLVSGLWLSFRRSREVGTQKATRFIGATLLAVLLTGMQEVTWIKFHLLFPVFPFIRSYARMYIILVIALALWFSRMAWRFEDTAKREGKSAGWIAAGAGVWLFALCFDYGYSWRSHMLPQLRCSDFVAAIRENPHPIYMSGAPDDIYTVPLEERGCYRDVRSIYARTGLPMVQGYEEYVTFKLKPSTPECESAKSRIRKAEAAYSPAGDGWVWWWFGGTPGDFERAKACLSPASVQVVKSVPEHDQTQGILSRLSLSR